MSVGRLRLEDGLVDLVHDPHKHAAVDPLHEGVSDVHTRRRAHRRDHTLASGEDRSRCQGRGQVCRFYLEEARVGTEL